MLLWREELELRKKEIENSKQQQNWMFEYLQTQNSQLFLLLACKIQNEQQPKWFYFVKYVFYFLVHICS